MEEGVLGFVCLGESWGLAVGDEVGRVEVGREPCRGVAIAVRLAGAKSGIGSRVLRVVSNFGLG